MSTNCSICLSALNDPVSIPCGHIYCTQCLSDHVNSPQDLALTASCPTCRTPFNLVLPDLTYLPKKYHSFMVPAVRRVYLDMSVHDALQKKLESAETRLKSQKRKGEELLKDCERLVSTLRAHRQGEISARLEILSLEETLQKAEEAHAIELEERERKHKLLVSQAGNRATSALSQGQLQIEELERRLRAAEEALAASKAGPPTTPNCQQDSPGPSRGRVIKPLPKKNTARRMRSASPPPNFKAATKKPRLSEVVNPKTRVLFDTDNM